VAEDGEHAYDLASKMKPDLIVTDVVMPYRDGIEVLKAIRRDPALEKIPVVLLSMKDREEDIVRGLELGADDYVVKPFNARELLARVRKQLDRSRGEP
jgi:DNA-binding response OmpR family regulator